MSAGDLLAAFERAFRALGRFARQPRWGPGEPAGAGAGRREAHV